MVSLVGMDRLVNQVGKGMEMGMGIGEGCVLFFVSPFVSSDKQ